MDPTMIVAATSFLIVPPVVFVGVRFRFVFLKGRKTTNLSW
jgi:hypothetical protein